jgi:hypothetical protein
MKILKVLLPFVAFGSPASRDFDSSQDGTEIGSSDEQDKMFFVNGFPVYPQSVAPIYYAPSTGYPYVMNPIMNAACTFSAGVMMPTMPVLQQPVYPNPNVPIYAPQQPGPVPNPNYRPPNQGPNQQPNQRPIQRPNQQPNQQPNQRPIQRPNQQPNQRPIQRPNQYPNQGPQQPGYGNGQPRNDYNNQNQNFGDKAYGDQIEDKFIPSVFNPYPAPIPGFYDINGMACNPYMQTVYMQQPVVYQQPYVYQQSIVVG